MHLHAPDMAVFHRLSQSLGCKVFRALAGIKHAATQIHRISAILHGGFQGVH